jgi:hypothetical protein
VVNVSYVLTLDRTFLAEHAGTLRMRLRGSVDAGLRLHLATVVLRLPPQPNSPNHRLGPFMVCWGLVNGNLVSSGHGS